MRSEELKGHLDAILLAALEVGPRHGYAVIETCCARAAAGGLDLPTGTIYLGAAPVLEQSGLDLRVVVGGRGRSAALLPAYRCRLSRRQPDGRSDWREFAAVVTAALEGGRMSGSGLIADLTFDVLSGQLPGPVVEEVADGLEETYRRYLRLGLALGGWRRKPRWPSSAIHG